MWPNPIAVSSALQIGHDQIHHVAEFTRYWRTRPSIALTLRGLALQARPQR